MVDFVIARPNLKLRDSKFLTISTCEVKIRTANRGQMMPYTLHLMVIGNMIVKFP